MGQHDSNKGDQKSVIYSDLFNAVKGASSTKERKSFAKENISNRPSSVNEDMKTRMTETRANPLEELSKNLFPMKSSANLFKENMKPITLGTPLMERNKQETPLAS